MTSSGTGPAGPLGRAWQRLSDREAARVRDVFLRAPQPPGSPRRALALGLALLVLLAYLGLLVLGAVWTWRALAPALGLGLELNPVARLALGFGGALLLLFAAQARPRFPQPPGQEVGAAQAPELHRLVGEVAAALGVRSPARLTIDGEVNAFMGQGSFPPRTTLGLGLPLLYALPPQERVALIAHELAHARNGDPTRGGLVAFALGVLGHMVIVLTPDAGMVEGASLLHLLSNGVMRLLSLVPLGLYHLLLALVGGDQQRAEFRADLLASEVAGSAATASLLDHLHFGDALETALHRQRFQPERPHAFLELRHIWATMPEARRQGRRDEIAAQRTRLDATHPPTADRIAVVGAHPNPPQVTLTPERAARLEAELTPLVPPIERAAYEAYQARYTG